MALFKILNNFNSGTPIEEATITHHTGYCYFDKTTGKLWVDTTNNASGMLQIGGSFFGICSTIGSTATKVVGDCPGFVLYNGASIYVKFTETNSAGVATLKLNVNGTGAYPIKRYGSTNLTDTGAIVAGCICNFVYDGSYWQWVGQMNTDTNTVPSAYCETVSSNAAKVATCTGFTLQDNSYVYVTFAAGNSSAGAITLNINGTGAQQVRINGNVTGQSNYTLPAGSYLAYYDGTSYQFRTDGVLPGVIAGNVVSITNDGSNIIYTMGDGTTAGFAVPHTTYTAGSSISINNDVITNTGVRAINQGTENGTISVNTGGTTRNVSVKGLGSAAYEASTAFASSGHTHGNINNIGEVSGNGVNPAVGDVILVADASNSNKLVKTTIEFDGATSNKFLSQAGTWENVSVAGSTTEALHASTANFASSANYARTASAAVTASAALSAGSATYATTASNAQNAGEAIHAASATYVTTAQNAVHAASAGYAVSAQKDANGNVITTTYATKSELEGLLASKDALVFKGTIGHSDVSPAPTRTTVPTNSYSAGDTYKIVSIDTYANNVCEPGDLLIAIKDGPASGSSVIAADWTVVQANLDGTVVGPASSTSGAFAIFSGSTGKAITGISGKGSSTLPIYIDSNGRPQTITSYQGKAASATYATYAASAGYASNAASTSYATSAGYAGTATTATNAIYASSAGYAANANYAASTTTASWALDGRHASCAGYAATASNAVNANKAVEATHAGTAIYASSAAFAASATTATAAVTATQAVHAATANFASSANYATTAGYATDNTKVAKSGDTMSGNLTIINYQPTVAIKGATAGQQIEFYVNDNSNYGGIYDRTNSKSVLYIGKNGDYLFNGYASCASYASSANTANRAIYSASAGFAQKATTADRAVYAASAGYAVNAASATYASSAGSATEAKYASSATFASSATTASNAVNAANAVHAASASMAAYATTAGQAVHAASATYAANATTAGNATEAAHAASSTYAQFASSANYATHAASATYAASAGEANTANSSNTSGTAAWAITANRAIYAYSATYVTTAQNAVHASTAGYAASALTASYSVTATDAKHATTADYAATAYYAVTAGNAVNALKATQDSKGKTIDTEYVHVSDFNTKLAATDAMQYKGTLGTGGTITALPATHSKGDTYKIITTGTYAGVKCELGDMVICLNDGTTDTSNDWTVVQTNLDGAVIGPASVTDGQIAVFDGTTGKLIKAATKSTGTVVTGLTWSAGLATTTSNVTADDITTWTPNAIPTATVNNGVLIFYAGTTATLAWSDKSFKAVNAAGSAPTLSWATATFVKSIA